MAEAKKADKEEKPEKKEPITLAGMMTEVIGVIIVILIILRFLGMFTTSDNYATIGFKNFLNNYGIADAFYRFIAVYTFFATILSLLFIIGIIYSVYQLSVLEKKWKLLLYPEPVEPGREPEIKNEKWHRVVFHINSENPSDWRLSILECDIMLDDVLDNAGYIGGTIGEKLKNADTAHFRTLNYAWEAHKIRNAIAHEGQDFTLTQREARRIVNLYETVFHEFNYI